LRNGRYSEQSCKSEKRKEKCQNGATYIRALLSLELSNPLVGSGGIAAKLNNSQRFDEDLTSSQAESAAFTCRRVDARLGATRVERRHWRAGVAKFLTANILTVPQSQRQTKGDWKVEERRVEERREEAAIDLVREEEEC
jgi:hypothetical protein